MFLRKFSKWICLFLVAWATTTDGLASSSFKLRYEGVIGGMADARLCYDAPFSFFDLEGIEWLLGLEDSGNYSCVTGTHPDAHSSLWQISPDGAFWGKRQGFEFAVVSSSISGKWEVSQILEFPKEIETPATCLLWMGNDGLYVVNGNELWMSDFDGNWSLVSGQVPDLSAYRSRGFVQSQNYVYSWSDEVGILIDKRTSSIMSFEEDGWPKMLADFEILGAAWSIDGDHVQVVNGDDMMQFDFGGKAVLPSQLLFSLDGEASFGELLFGAPQDERVRSLIGWLLPAILVITLIVLLRNFLLRGRLRMKPSTVFPTSSVSKSGTSRQLEVLDYGFSDSFLEIVNRSSDVLTMEDFDQLAHGGEKLSPESQRARRSKLFREINAESKLVMGYDLLVRERDPQDRRKVRYRVQSLPPRIQRIVQALKTDVPSVPVEQQGNR